MLDVILPEVLALRNNLTIYACCGRIQVCDNPTMTVHFVPLLVIYTQWMTTFVIQRHSQVRDKHALAAMGTNRPEIFVD